MYIAKTVQDVANQSDPMVATIVNREHEINRAFIDRAISLTQFSWHGRRPIPAFDPKGDPRDHDLDLLSVMVELAKRQAYVKLPGYSNMLPWQVVAGEQHVGTDRYGKILRLVSHREHLSFSVQIQDESLYQHSDASFGAPRTYSMVDYNGVWHQGWRGINWRFAEDEAEFFQKRHLLHDGELGFKYYVHPHRRQSFGSRAYLILKLLWQRLEDEARFYSEEKKRLACLGISVPLDLIKTSAPVLERGESRNAFVQRFVMKLSGPEFRSEYESVSEDEAGYRLAHERWQEIVYDLQPLVQFVVRANEAAFYCYGMEGNFTPWWIKGPEWEYNPQSKWTSLHITDGLSLSYVTDEVPKQVAA